MGHGKGLLIYATHEYTFDQVYARINLGNRASGDFPKQLQPLPEIFSARELDTWGFDK